MKGLSQDAIGQDYANIFSWEGPNARRQTGRALCAKLDELLCNFDTRVDLEGVVVDGPVAKKRRKGRRVSGSKDEQKALSSDELEIKIGAQKRTAIKNILLWATPESYRMMCVRLSNFVGGGERRSAVTPEVLAWKYFWTMSPSPDGQSPSEAEEVARRQCKKMVPDRVTSTPLQFGVELSPADHNTLVAKTIAIFEGDAERSKGGPIPKVTVDALWNFRFVVQHWNRSVKLCAETDLDPDTCKLVSEALLFGDALDTQLITALRSFPLEFALTMLPDVKSLKNDMEEVSEDSVLEKAEKEAWCLCLRSSLLSN